MYYEETIIEGVLHVRGTPNGKWRKLSATAITLKYMEAKREAAQQGVQADSIEACEKCARVVSVVSGMRQEASR
jgi:hypothetical protein